MSELPPPPPDDPGWSSQPPPPPGPPSHAPQDARGWATLGTGETLQLATPGARIGARVIDWIILGLVLIVLATVLFVSFSRASFEFDLVGLGPAMTAEEQAAENRVIATLGVASAAIVMLYEVALIAWRGQTVGKMALKIKVVRADNGLVPGWGKSAGRWLVPAIPGLVGWLNPSISFIGLLSFLVYASLTWDKARQGWHDKAVKTLVVKV